MRLVLFVVLVPVAAAFASLPMGAPHDTITEDAAHAADYPEAGIAALLEAVRAPDIEEFHAEVGTEGQHIDANDEFRPEHHCDRVPPEGNESAFSSTTQYIQQQRDQAQQWGSAAEAVAALGRALHAAQDCFSHSNFPDLSEQAREAFVRAVLQGGEAPPGTIVTAFAPGTNDPGRPSDPYPHDHYAKDSPDTNAESQRELGGRTTYEIARDAATQATAAILAQFLGPLDADQREALADLRASQTAGRPGPAPLLFLPLLAAWALRRR